MADTPDFVSRRKWLLKGLIGGIVVTLSSALLSRCPFSSPQVRDDQRCTGSGRTLSTRPIETGRAGPLAGAI